MNKKNNFLNAFIFTVEVVWLILGVSGWQRADIYMTQEHKCEDPINFENAEAIYPFAKWTMIVMTVLRPVLNIVSLWKPGVCQSYLYYHFIFLMAKNSFPRTFGTRDMEVFTMTAFETVLNFSTGHSSAKDFWAKLLIFFAAYFYIMALMPYLLFYQDKSLLDLFTSNVVGAIFWIPTFVCFELTLNWFGYLYLRAELPRKGNEMLLENLQEGVFIFEEESTDLLFQNSAGKQINKRFQTDYGFSVAKKGDRRDNIVINKLQEQFEPVDRKKLYSLDFPSAVEYLNESEEKKSLDTIISDQLDEG